MAKLFIRKIILRKLFQNSVLVFVHKLANQRGQRQPMHRFYRHTGRQISKGILLCSLDLLFTIHLQHRSLFQCFHVQGFSLHSAARKYFCNLTREYT
jgi:hypothetical protein